LISNFNRAEAIFSSYAESGRLPHATLVECQSAENALEFAKRLAAAALCRGEKPRPCGACRDCVKLSHGVHPDLAVISGGEKAKSFHVDAIRDIRQDAHVKPSEADCRVFVLQNAQNMTAQAQNALLKIIEEPPNGVYFVLTCENRATLLATLLSRLAVLPLESGADTGNDGERAQKAKELLDMLAAGREFDSLAALSAYERDRAGLAALLAAIKAEAASRLAAAVKDNQAIRSEQEKLLGLIENAERLEAALAANVSGLLLTSMIIAGNR
jgi:DNA polymerase-3 subunit delta'